MLEALVDPSPLAQSMFLAVAWLPFLCPALYCLARRGSVPRKLFFILTCCSLTFGLPVFFFTAIEAPAVLLTGSIKTYVVTNGLLETAPFSWVYDAASLVLNYWWLATALGLPVLTAIWSILVTRHVGARWSAIIESAYPRKRAAAR